MQGDVLLRICTFQYVHIVMQPCEHSFVEASLVCYKFIQEPPFWDMDTGTGVHFILVQRDSPEWHVVLRESQGAFDDTQVLHIMQDFLKCVSLHPQVCWHLEMKICL